MERKGKIKMDEMFLRGVEKRSWKNNLKYIANAFACNAKSFAIVIIYFFLFFSTANLDGLTKVAYQNFYIC